MLLKNGYELLKIFSLSAMCLVAIQSSAFAQSQDSLSSYGDRNDVRQMINYAMNAREPSFTHRCYRYVKQAIYAGGLADYGTLQGGSAYMAVRDLSQEGFLNLLDTYRRTLTRNELEQIIETVPKGTILVFQGNRRYVHGDVAIKTDEGYVNDYFSPRPITQQWNGANYRLIGAMVKLGRVPQQLNIPTLPRLTQTEQEQSQQPRFEAPRQTASGEIRLAVSRSLAEEACQSLIAWEQIGSDYQKERALLASLRPEIQRAIIKEHRNGKSRSEIQAKIRARCEASHLI